MLHPIIKNNRTENLLVTCKEVVSRYYYFCSGNKSLSFSTFFFINFVFVTLNIYLKIPENCVGAIAIVTIKMSFKYSVVCMDAFL